MTPGFGRPTAFRRPASSSTIVGFGYPSRGCGPTLFVTTAPAPAWYTRAMDPPASSRNPDASIEIGEHTSELQSHHELVCRLLLEKKKEQSPRHSRQRGLPRLNWSRPQDRCPRGSEDLT